jgi:hypothetical protein
MPTFKLLEIAHRLGAFQTVRSRNPTGNPDGLRAGLKNATCVKNAIGVSSLSNVMKSHMRHIGNLSVYFYFFLGKLASMPKRRKLQVELQASVKLGCRDTSNTPRHIEPAINQGRPNDG